MELKDRDELISDLGGRILDDADKLRLFIPDHIGVFWFTWHGRKFKVSLHMDEGE